ncbi:MAG: biotin--[acetyl-CoA-carboxylase] ligase [Deltaproteobacteria bacterium]|nr:biotin--[acetyl-CoA-carboxylase] ligase [Deltaproteobacteria bacterium]
MMKLVQLETCESTNDEAWKHLPETTLVVTRHQTRGRGRQGRKWEDDAGNIMASLALAPIDGLSERLTWLPLAAGVAAGEMLSVTAGRDLAGLRLKWPNDVMWEDAKMGGLLCETRFSGERLVGVVVGFGLNVERAPDVAGMKTACVGAHAKDFDRARFLGLWADRVQYWAEELAQGRTSKLREAWLRLAKLERFPAFTVHDASGETVKLTALDLDDAGRLKAQAGPSKIVFLDQPA